MAVTRKARKAQTREALLDAAGRVFARRGFHEAGLGEIAREAGYSTGAIYASFTGKKELFVAVVDRQFSREMAALSRAVEAEETLDRQLRLGASYWMTLVRREPELLRLRMELWARAMRDPELKELYVERRRALTDRFEQDIGRAARQAGVALPMDARDVAIAFEALADGLALRALAEPEDVPDDLFADVLSILGLAAAAITGAHG